MIMLRSLVLVAATLAASVAASGATQKWCQSAELIPKNDPTSWVTANDFPTHLYFRLQKPFHSTGVYRIFVTADGRSKQCTVVAATTSDMLDTSTCANLKRRARFNQLYDANCADVVRGYDHRVRFKIPSDKADPQVTTSRA